MARLFSRQNQAAPARSLGRIDPAQLVRALVPQVDQLVDLRKVAAQIAAETIENVRATAAAVLVPDGAVWHIAGGFGLRDAEFRYEIGPDHWLVREILVRRRAAIIEDTDIARQELRGAPLASRRHLLVLSSPGPSALYLVARDEDPGFRESDITRLERVAATAEPDLFNALDLRDLARKLEPFTAR